jgi:hypothetical protein
LRFLFFSCFFFVAPGQRAIYRIDRRSGAGGRFLAS